MKLFCPHILSMVPQLTQNKSQFLQWSVDPGLHWTFVPHFLSDLIFHYFALSQDISAILIPWLFLECGRHISATEIYTYYFLGWNTLPPRYLHGSFPHLLQVCSNTPSLWSLPFQLNLKSQLPSTSYLIFHLWSSDILYSLIIFNLYFPLLEFKLHEGRHSLFAALSLLPDMCY